MRQHRPQTLVIGTHKTYENLQLYLAPLKLGTRARASHPHYSNY